MPVDRERLRALHAEQAWASDWPHNIVPSGRHAHILACEAIRALPALLDQIDALEARCEALGGGCDANNGGLHSAMQQSKYWFCPDCGLSLRRHTYTLPHVKPAALRAALTEEPPHG